MAHVVAELIPSVLAACYQTWTLMHPEKVGVRKIKKRKI